MESVLGGKVTFLRRKVTFWAALEEAEKSGFRVFAQVLVQKE
jgi:hypothetical protein